MSQFMGAEWFSLNVSFPPNRVATGSITLYEDKPF